MNFLEPFSINERFMADWKNRRLERRELYSNEGKTVAEFKIPRGYDFDPHKAIAALKKLEKEKEKHGRAHKDKHSGDPAADMEFYHKMELDPENHARDTHELIRYREAHEH